MEKKEFKELWDKLPSDYADKNGDKRWKEALDDWEEYREQIINDLPLDKWLKNKDGYLPDFLDTKEKFFGHARIGNYEQAMIYQYTGKEASREGKYYDFYNKAKYIEDKNDVEKDYCDNIQSLLKDLVDADSLDEIRDLEKSESYRTFKCKQILRKITVLESIRDNCKYKNCFVWIYDKNVINKLVDIFKLDLEDKTFFEKSSEIYKEAKNWTGIKQLDKKDYYKLNKFLWDLTDTNDNIAELIDFNNINIIFNGAPGTGKTYGVTKGIEKIEHIYKNDDKKLKYKYIQFHPSYTYQDFIEGIKPFEMKDGNLNLKVVNGSFKQFCIDVKKENEEYYKKSNPKKSSDFSNWPHYYFVVDEINRGNLSSIFGETFTLLEKDYRDYDFSGKYDGKVINLVSTPLSNVISKLSEDERKELAYKEINGEAYFGIPFNIHFIGMMNDVDRSIDSFDLALRRRFKWIAKYCDYDVLKDELLKKYNDSESVNAYIDNCRKLNEFISGSQKAESLRLGRSYEIGHAFFMKIKDISSRDKLTKANKEELFNNYLSCILKEYIRQVADESEIDDYIDKAKEAFGIK